MEITRDSVALQSFMVFIDGELLLSYSMIGKLEKNFSCLRMTLPRCSRIISIIVNILNCCGANFNPGTYHPQEGSVTALGARLIISSTCKLYLNSRLLHSRPLSVTVMSLVPQPHPSPGSDEHHNMEVQDKIDTERDNETK